MTTTNITEGEIESGLVAAGAYLVPGQFTYSIANALSTWSYYAANTQPDNGYSILSAAQAAAFRLAIASWDALIAPGFTEVTETATTAGEIRVAFTSYDMDPGTAAYAFLPTQHTANTSDGDVWINASETGDDFSVGTDLYVAMMHEIGHALGLKHPFEAPLLPAAFDSTRYTLMSYTTATPYFSLGFAGTGGGGITTTSQRVITTTPMVLDIAAVQSIYGADTTTGAGDTTYTFTESDTSIRAITDAGGNDTLDLSNFTHDNLIDLRPGAYSSLGYWTIAQQTAYWQAQFPTYSGFIQTQMTSGSYYTWQDNFGIAFNTTIENANGGSGNDTITGNDVANTLRGNAGNDTLDGGLGDDTMIGGTGDDIYYVDSLGDVVTELAGEGTADEIRTSVANLALPGNVERMVYTGSSNTSFTGTSADNSFTGSTGADYFNLAQGGTDTASGGGGSDGFYFGEMLSAGDSVDGGTGTDDQLGIQGTYSYTFSATNLVGIETLAIISGHDNRFGDNSGSNYSYNLTTIDANVAATTMLTVNANNLRAGENLTFNGSAETDGSFFFYAGLGTDSLTGGQLNDGFFFGEGGRFAPTDHVDGQGGTDDQLGIRGDYSALTTFSATSMVNIETLALLSAQDSRFAPLGTAYSYNLKLDNANVAAGSMLTVSGNNLRADESMAVDGSSETDGSFRFFAGAGADTLKGGAGGDQFTGGLGKDVMTGNGGNDTFYFRTTAESAVGASADQITDFTVGDHIDLSQIDADTVTGGDQAFTFIDTAAFGSHAGEARITGAGASWTLQVDTDGDGNADMEIAITTTGGHTPVASDFIL